MPRITNVLLKARRSIHDSNLLKVLQSEINHELTSTRFQNDESGPLKDFAVDWDSSKSQDVVLRRKSESGEELAVSALLGRFVVDESDYPREVLMKVCVRKPGLSSILQFDCGVCDKPLNKAGYYIQNVHVIHSLSCLGYPIYKGPLFSYLDPKLQDELKQYLEVRGIGESFARYLLVHMHKKEQAQYVDWLHKLESLVSESE